MNPFLLPAPERLAEWRAFRLSLDGLSEYDQLDAITKWFAQAPTVTFALDFDHPETWPGPWEVMNDGMFCSTAIAYLMEQTLLLMGWDPDRLTLRYVRNQKKQEQMMILLVDDRFALNYEYNGVFNFDNDRPDCAYLVSYKPTGDGGHLEI